MGKLEDPIHKAIVEFLRWQYPKDLLHHSPNEGNRGGVRGAMDGKHRKEMGVLSGFPDLFQMGEGRLWFWEVKAKGGQTSQSQKNVGQMIVSLGGRWAIVRSVDDVKDRIKAWDSGPK